MTLMLMVVIQKVLTVWINTHCIYVNVVIKSFPLTRVAPQKNTDNT